MTNIGLNSRPFPPNSWVKIVTISHISDVNPVEPLCAHITNREPKSSNMNNGGGGGGAAASSSGAGGNNGGNGGDSSCCESPSDNEGTAANVSFADTIDHADLDLETRGDR